MSANLVIGIDPGVDTGFAIYDRDARRLVELVKIDFGRAIVRIEELHLLIDHIRIERTTTKHNWHTYRMEKELAMKISFDVGMNQREAQLLVSECRRRNLTVVEVAPLGKIDKHVFRRMTGWTGRTGEHTRDAGMLCFGH